MGRKPLASPRVHDIHLRVSEEERRMLEERLAETGRSITGHIVELIRADHAKAKRDRTK